MILEVFCTLKLHVNIIIFFIFNVIKRFCFTSNIQLCYPFNYFEEYLLFFLLLFKFGFRVSHVHCKSYNPCGYVHIQARPSLTNTPS